MRSLSVYKWLLLLTFAAPFAPACSEPQQEPQTIANAQQAYDTGQAAMEAGDYFGAQQQLSAAVESGGLNPDLLVDAYLKLAVAEAHLGNFAAAHAALETASQGAADMQRVAEARKEVEQREKSAGR